MMVTQNFKTKITRITSLIYFLGLYALFQLCNSSKFRLLRSEDQSINFALKINLFLNNFRLDPVVDITHPKRAAFWSCLSPKNYEVDTDLHCVYRVSGTEGPGMNFIRRIVVDGTKLPPHNIVEEKDLRAEDPHVFTWNDEAYVLNNNWRIEYSPYVGDNFFFERPVGIFHVSRTSDGFGQVIDYFQGNASGPNFPKDFIKNITTIAISDKRIIFIDFQDKNAISCTRQNKPGGFQFTLNCMLIENIIYNYESDIVEEGIGKLVVDRLALRFLLDLKVGLVI